MNVVTPSQMVEIDRQTMESHGLHPLVLMENAARSCLTHLPTGRRATILVGPGNNGGDGLVLARALKEEGRQVTCLVFSENLSPQAESQRQLALKWGLNLIPVADQQALEEQQELLEQSDLIIDALFGTGLSRELEGRYRAAVVLANSTPARRFAIDIPSGIDGRNGAVLGAAFRAHSTVTFGCLKLAHVLYPGREHCGELHLTQPGFHPDALEMYDQVQYFDKDWAARFLPKPWPTMHKGDNGKLLLVTGSSKYPGAGALSVLGALRGGAGLVTHSCDPNSTNAVLSLAPECMPLPRPQFPDLRSFHAIVIGCGLGPDTDTMGSEVLKQASVPVVVDADAIPLIKGLSAEQRARMIITPHPGEMARLLEISVDNLEKRRVTVAQEAAATFDCVVCLKGAPTVTAAPDGRTFINSSGHSVLAQGGSGDLLAGLIGAYLAYGLPLLDAAAGAAYIHGLAAELAAEKLGQRGSTAHLIADLVPIAYSITVGK